MAKSNSPRYKGKVGVSVNRNTLRIRLPRFLFNGKQKFVYTGLKDTTRNRKVVEAKAKQIEADIVFERFDFSLESYKSDYCFSQSKRHESLTLLELYTRFMEAKKPTVRPGTYNNGYKVALSHLKRSPYFAVVPDVDQTGFAQQLADWAGAELTADTAKRFLVQLNACMNWAINSEFVSLEKSPFTSLAQKASKRRRGGKDWQINTFSLEQRNAIIEAYRQHPKYCHYYPYVAFCFFVGCRPSEAIALERGDISLDLKQVTFSSAVVLGESGKKRVKGLKTQERRTINTSQSVQIILKEALNRSSNHIVFPGIKQGWLGERSFRQSWREILQSLGLEYRRPYQMRHTFITLSLGIGVPVKNIARMVGNSPEIIYRHYVENQSQIIIPDF